MPDRPVSQDAALSGPAWDRRPRWPFAFMACAGLIGAAGVAVGAAGAHVGGGELARTSSEFLMIHAAGIVAASAAAVALGRTSALLVAALGLLTVGTALFGGELAVNALLGWRPVPLAAPTGGLCLIAGWLTLTGAAAVIGLRRA